MPSGEHNQRPWPLAWPAGRSARLGVALGAAALAAALAGTVRAADDAGMRDFLLSESRSSRAEAPRPAAPVAAPLPVWAPAQPLPRSVTSFDPARKPHAKPAREPRTTFASLPPTRDALGRGRQVDADEEPPVKVKSIPGAALDPVGAFLKDDTLRPGDIVVFPDGPRVFKGGETLPHRISRFESIDRSRLVSQSTRKTVTALTRRARGAAREAARYVPASATVASAAPASGELVRVVYPAGER